MESELEQLGERIAEQAAHFDAAMHRLLTDLRAFDERGGWHAQGALSCAHWLAWRVGWDLVTARERVRVARRLADFPQLDDALRRGEISYSKIRALVRVATPANESLLLDHARLMTASQLEKLCRKYALVQRHDEDIRPDDDAQRRHVRRRDTADGMVKIEAVLHPEEAELIWKMLDHAAARLRDEPGTDDSAESPDVTDTAMSGKAVASIERSRSADGAIAASRPKQLDVVTRGFDRADALVWLAQQYLRGDSSNRSPIEVVLTIPKASLRSRATTVDDVDMLEAGELGESFVPCETARRLSCDAGVVEVVEDEHGAPLSVGRKQRTIAGALKRALYRRDRMCTFPGCTHRMFLEGHHIRHWADDGETSLANAALLCSAHHRFVHEYGYTIELVAGHQPLFRDPRGRLVQVVPGPPRWTAEAAEDTAIQPGWPWLRAANASLAIDAETIACGWDGSAADYGLIVDHLMAVDR